MIKVLVLLMELSVDLLRVFVTLAEERSFSKAAKKLPKSQSALSGQIANFEAHIGLKLFDRSERPLTLTESGQIFYHFAIEFLNKVDQLSRLFKELSSGITGEITIGAAPSLGVSLLPKLVAKILLTNPKLRITISVLRRYQVYDAVRRAEVDFALVLTDRRPEGLLAKPLKTEKLCFIVSPKHPLAERRRIGLAEIRSTPFVLGTITSEWTEMVNRLLKNVRLANLPVALRVNNDQAVKEVVRAGIGAAILPEFAVERELLDKSLCQLNIVDARLNATIFLIERVRHLYSPGVAAVKDLLEKSIVGTPQE
jgi:DNA-binding transcriptional LysR family regulator